MDNMYRKQLKKLRKYTPGKSVESVKKEYSLEYINKLASNENPLGPSPKSIEAMIKEAKSVHLYPDPLALELTNELSKHWGVDSDQLILGNGGEEILSMIAKTFINPGDEAIMASPSFGLYQSSVSLMGGKAIEIPLTKEFEHNFDGFLNYLSDKTKLVYVCNPNNPTGNIMSKDKMDPFVDKLAKDVVLVIDEAYFEFAKINENYPDGLDYLKKRPNTVILRTFSKVAGLAGVRVGYGISSPEIISEMKKTKGVFNVNRMAQVAASGALTDSKHIHATVELNYKSLNMMELFCNKNKIKFVPSNSNFMFIKSPIDSKIIFEEMQKKGVIVRPGFLWGYDDWIRVSTGGLDQTQGFLETFTKIVNEISISNYIL